MNYKQKINVQRFTTYISRRTWPVGATRPTAYLVLTLWSSICSQDKSQEYSKGLHFRCSLKKYKKLEIALSRQSLWKSARGTGKADPFYLPWTVRHRKVEKRPAWAKDG